MAGMLWQKETLIGTLQKYCYVFPSRLAWLYSNHSETLIM